MTTPAIRFDLEMAAIGMAMIHGRKRPSLLDWELAEIQMQALAHLYPSKVIHEN